LLASAPVLARDKTDVIVMRNGDRVTGEILQFEYGLLQLSTDDMGTINIEWNAIASIDSNFTFDVERIGGQRYAGVIATSEDGQSLVVQGTETASALPLSDVVRFDELEAGFWQRVSGSLSLGFNYTKSSGIQTGSLNVSSQYQGPRVKSKLDISTIETSSPETESTAREQISSTVEFRSERPSFLLLLNSLERNDELGIDRRLQSGAAIARYFLQDSDSEVMALAGAVANQEWTSGVDDEVSSLEAVFGVQWRIFRFSDPEVSLSSSAYLYPSITESGRRRGNLDISLRREVISDLFFDISLYESYDSHPPAEGTTTDYGIVTSLGYKF
jgi:hypothetical protein